MRSIFFIISSILIVGSILFTGVLWAEAPTDIYVTSKSTPTNITIGWVGDMVPSIDEQYNENVFFTVSTELQKPDLMIGNLEGTFANPTRLDKCRFILTLCHAFRGDISFAYAIKSAGFDLVSLVNNHSYDYMKEGLEDTETVLTEAGIAYISPTKPSTSIVIKDTKIGILALSSTEPSKTITDYTFIQKEVVLLKETNDFVIVIFHGGAEGADKTIVPGVTEYMGTEDRGNVELMAHTAVDAGADLVLGSGPHVLRKIETYSNTPIAYSLGNFVGANRKLTTTGILGTSGIFTATLQKDTPTTYDFTSVRLSPEGVPAIDPFQQGKYLIDSL